MPRHPARQFTTGCLPRVATAMAVLRLAVGLGVLVVLAAACSGSTRGRSGPAPTEPPVPAATSTIERDADVPELPFPDNPDPNACGIPTLWPAYPAWVNGVYQDRLIEPTVWLYDSHERLHIVGAVPSGTAVQVELYQANPVLDFYYVRAETPAGPQKGWVPAPFLQFTPPNS